MSQALDERICSYLGRSHQSRDGYDEKSAEVIVVDGKRAVIEIQMDSQVNEGLNINLPEIELGILRCIALYKNKE